MRVIEKVEELLAGVGLMSFFIGILFLGGALDSDKSVIPGLILIVVGLAFGCLLIVAISYEEWQEAERNRIRHCIEHYGRNVYRSHNGGRM